MHYATAVLYIFMASILSRFDIEAVDSAGNPVQIEAKFSDCEHSRISYMFGSLISLAAFISYAEEFPCRITPRNRIDATIL